MPCAPDIPASYFVPTTRSPDRPSILSHHPQFCLTPFHTRTHHPLFPSNTGTPLATGLTLVLSSPPVSLHGPRSDRLSSTRSLVARSRRNSLGSSLAAHRRSSCWLESQTKERTKVGRYACIAIKRVLRRRSLAKSYVRNSHHYPGPDVRARRRKDQRCDWLT